LNSGRTYGQSRNHTDTFYWLQAAEIDPQARWIIQGVWNSLLDSRALDASSLSDKKVGVYCGIMNNDMVEVRNETGVPFSLNSTFGSVAGVVSHVYGFKGPSMDVNTLCSSGLVCLQIAREALQCQTCDVAIVAAANWAGGLNNFERMNAVHALSATGIADCLGRGPNGYVRGEGMVCLVLMRLDDITPDCNLRGILEAVERCPHEICLQLHQHA
jgi:acyl transferase domain-containing protein